MTSGPATAVLTRRRLPLAVAAGLLIADQLTKWWALERLDDGSTIDLVWTLRFRLVFNEGMSFSLGQGLGWLVGLIGLVVVAVLVVWAGRIDPRSQRVAVGAVIGGAVGNLVDRIFRADDGPLSGAVVDFIDLQWWPVFNVADMALVVGVIVLVGLLAVEDHRLSASLGAEAGADAGALGSGEGADGDVAGAGPLDAGPTDAGPTDAGPTDAGSIVAGPTDADQIESGPTRGGPLDVGPTDADLTDAGNVEEREAPG
ncbi:MAG: signal peptidase II [Actinomycetota bacterium]